MTDAPKTNTDTGPTDPSHPDHPEHETFRERFEHLVETVEEAAIEAEYATGEREATEELARAHIVVRLARMTLGTVVLILGIIAIPLPGPGWLIVAAGLAILAKDVAWAERLLRYIRKRVPGIPEDGKIPPSSMATMAAITAAAVAASLWWTLGRGSDSIQAGTYPVESVVQATESGPSGEAGLELVITDEGPILLRSNECRDLSIEVSERSKDTFTLASADLGDCDPSSLSGRAAAGLSDRVMVLGYETSGVRAWFFADDSLASASTDAVVLTISS